MTERFMLDDAGELIDLNNHRFVDYGDEVVELLNELHEETQSVKDILNELNEYDGYWDSAILTDIIERIADKLGVELE